MKKFKKLMAVALAGVLALTVLTGCGATVNKKEFLAMLSDMKTLGEDKVDYTDAGKGQANTVIELVQKAYNDTKDAEKADFDPMKALCDKDATMTFKSAAVNKALGITENTQEHYDLSIVELKKYQSQFNNDHATLKLVAEVVDKAESLNDGAETRGNKGTVSMNTVTLGDKEYLVVVMKVIA